MSQRLLSRCQARFTAPRTQDEVPVVRLRATSQPSHVTRSDKRRISQQGFQLSYNSRDELLPSHVSQPATASPIGERAKQRQADKEFFTDLLSSAATKRDAKAYISRLKSPTKLEPASRGAILRSKVNLGTLFTRSRALNASPTFIQHGNQKEVFSEMEVQHIALVKLSGINNITTSVLHGIAQTLSQLSRLGMVPCVILEAENHNETSKRQILVSEADRLSTAFDTLNEKGSRIVDNCLTISSTDNVYVGLPQILQRPLRTGQIPVVLPVAYSEKVQKMVSVSADRVIEAIVSWSTASLETASASRLVDDQQQPISLDRIIIIDEAGGLPNKSSADGKHVFVNLEQEFETLNGELRKLDDETSGKHMANLKLMRTVLRTLPPSSSGLLTSPTEASNLGQSEELHTGLMVGTRRQKNALIHNLLTDKPAFSASLPDTRRVKKTQAISPPPVSTFVKHGMTLKIFPDPRLQPWTATAPRVKLTDSTIDLDSLVHLIDDSFNRKLDIENYLARVNDNIAGVIVAGDYEGGAILTWETPPGVDPQDKSRQVPYLDKFAVLKKSQGAGGVADIVFNAMVRTCFPRGVCWRSRKDNPVNKWYFERSSGTWKIPGINWTMFWTTSGVTAGDHTFRDYEAVCRAIQPTWINKAQVAD